MASNVITLPGTRAVPAEARALFGLLSAISSRDLRRYCLEQLGAAEHPEEVTAAVELTRAIAHASARATRAGVTRQKAQAGCVVTDIGQGAAVQADPMLRENRTRKAACIATSSSQ